MRKYFMLWLIIAGLIAAISGAPTNSGAAGRGYDYAMAGVIVPCSSDAESIAQAGLNY